MKHLLPLLILLSAVVPARSQDNAELDFVLQKIISDSSAFFNTYRGEVKRVPNYDSLYQSTLTIPGTFNNEISFSSGSSTYFATMAEMKPEKEANSLLKKWKQQLKKALGAGYIMTDHEETYLAGQPTKVYSFTKGNIVVRVFRSELLGPGKKESACFVHMYIAYEIKK